MIKKEKNQENECTKAIERYWCKNCNREHRRFKNINKLTRSKIFLKHLKHREILSLSEKFKKNFQRKWNKESMKKTSITNPILKIN